GKEETIEADYVLVTVGRKPNTQEIGLEQVGVEVDDKGLIKIDKQCRTNVKNIYAIGDIVDGLPLAHKASYEGKVAAEEIGRASCRERVKMTVGGVPIKKIILEKSE